jgi:thiamine kinase-like enzyme
VNQQGLSLTYEDGIDAITRSRAAELLNHFDLPQLDGRRLHLRILPGGTINQSLIVEGAEVRYVLRIVPTPEVCDSLSIDCAQSALALEAASKEGLAPQLVARELAEGHALVRYIEAESLTAEVLRNNGHIGTAGTVLARLHRIDLPGLRARSMFEEVDKFAEVAETTDAMTDAWAESVEAMEPIRDLFENLSETRFCHRDTNPQNMIAQGRTLYLVDFDYAGKDSPYVDLAILSEYAQLSGDEQWHLLESYAKSPTEVDSARVRLMRYVHNVRDGLYAAGSAGLVADRVTTRDDWLPTAAESGTEEANFYETYAQLNLRAAIAKRADDRFIGDLRLAGEPGGTVVQ